MNFSVRKVTALPSPLEANTVYYVKGASESGFQIFVTNSSGTIVATPLGYRASASIDAATHVPVFTADPASTTRELVTRTPAQLINDAGAVTKEFESVMNLSAGVYQTVARQYERIFSGSNTSVENFLRPINRALVRLYDAIVIRVFVRNTTSINNKLGILKFWTENEYNSDYLEIQSVGTSRYAGVFEITITYIGDSVYEIHGQAFASKGVISGTLDSFFRTDNLDSSWRPKISFLSGQAGSSNYGGNTQISYTIDYKRAEDYILINDLLWNTQSSNIDSAWTSVVYNDDAAASSKYFVAVASSGTNRIMTSSDGITWIARSAAEANPWQSVTYGNGLFVAVASSGTNKIMTSPNGTTWTARSDVGGLGEWKSVTWGGGQFVAVGNTSPEFSNTRVMTSSDGINWTARTAPQQAWQSVTYGNGLFVAVASSGTNRVMTSPDGITWTSRSASAQNNWQSVTYGNGLFVAVSSDGTNRVMTSPDGITWTSRSASAQNNWQSVTYGNGLFVAVASDGTNRTMTSTDGITWTSRSASAQNSWSSVAYSYDLGKFVAVSSTGTNRVMTADY